MNWNNIRKLISNADPEKTTFGEIRLAVNRVIGPTFELVTPRGGGLSIIGTSGNRFSFSATTWDNAVEFALSRIPPDFCI